MSREARNACTRLGASRGGCRRALLRLHRRSGPGAGTSSPPALTDSTQKVYAYFSAHHSHLKLAAAFYALAMSAVLCWLPAFYGLLRRAMDEFPPLALGAAAGIVLAAAMSVSTAAIEATIACRIGEIDPSLTRVLYTLQQFTQGGILFGLLVAIGLAGVVSLQSGLYGRWFALASLVLALLSLAGGSALAYANHIAQALGSISLSLDSLWILVVSILLYRKPALALPATP